MIIHDSNFRPMGGPDNPMNVELSPLVAKEVFSGSSSITKDFAQPMNGFTITNDGATDLTFTINGMNIIVKSGESFQEAFEPFTQVAITTTAAYRAYVMQGATSVSMSVPASPVPDTIPPGNVATVNYSAITANSVTLSWPVATGDVFSYDVYDGTTFVGNTASTTYTVTGLSPNTNYTFVVKSRDGIGNVSSGTSIFVSTGLSSDTTPPAEVTGLLESSITQSGVTLSWTASIAPDIKDYRIYNGATLLNTVTGTTVNITGLTPGTGYTLTVKARDINNNESMGMSRTFSTAAPDTTPPAEVSGVNATSVTSNSATLNWTASPSPDIKDYRIYNGATLLGSATDTTFNVTGLTADTHYTTIVVKARDTSNNESTGTPADFTTAAAPAADTTPPNKVTGVTAGTPTSTSVPITWTVSTSTDVTRQEVAYAVGTAADRSTLNFTVASAVVNASSTSYSFTGLTASQAYTFRVIAIDGANNRSIPEYAEATTASGASPAVASDDFNRGTVTSLGTAPTGQVWTSGGFQIVGDQAMTPTAVSGSNAWATLETGQADNIEITCDVTFDEAFTSSTMVGIVFRWGALSTMYSFGLKNKTTIGLFSNNVTGLPASKTVTGMSAGVAQRLKVRLMGQTVQCFLNDVEQYNFQDTVNTAYTKHGIGMYSNTTAHIDNFSVNTI